MSVSPAPDRTVASAVRDAILLVEDDDMVAPLIAQVLERNHWRVLRAAHGAEAEAAVARHGATIALALVDGRLPDMDGAVLCERLRGALPGLPVLIVSGRECSSLARALAAGGPAAFLAKPFMPVEVTRHVANLMAQAA